MAAVNIDWTGCDLTRPTKVICAEKKCGERTVRSARKRFGVKGERDNARLFGEPDTWFAMRRVEVLVREKVRADAACDIAADELRMPREKVRAAWDKRAAMGKKPGRKGPKP